MRARLQQMDRCRSPGTPLEAPRALDAERCCDKTKVQSLSMAFPHSFSRSNRVHSARIHEPARGAGFWDSVRREAKPAGGGQVRQRRII